MQLTPNYKLKKPEGTDPVDIQDFNDNADLIDAALKKKAESSGGDISGMTVKTLDDITTEFPVPVAGESTKTFLGKVKKFFSDTKNWMTGVCLIGQIVNNCVTNNAKLPLSAAQGKVLMDLYNVLNTNLELSSATGITAIEDPEITGEIYYRVKAGVCYIKCNITTQSTSVRNGAILCNGLPKTAVGQSRYCSNGPGTIGIGVIYIDNNTTALKINLSGRAGNGYTSFSYPIYQ